MAKNDADRYAQTRAETDAEMAKPQHFPLTGDGLVASRVIASGPFNGGGHREEIVAARYRDWEWRHGDPEAAKQREAAYWKDRAERRGIQHHSARQTQTRRLNETQALTLFSGPRSTP